MEISINSRRARVGSTQVLGSHWLLSHSQEQCTCTYVQVYADVYVCVCVWLKLTHYVCEYTYYMFTFQIEYVWNHAISS